MFRFFIEEVEDGFMEIDSSCDKDAMTEEELMDVDAALNSTEQTVIPSVHVVAMQKEKKVSQLLWEKKNKLYAMAYDEHANIIEIRKVNNNNQLAYWDPLKKQVIVFENKNDHTFDGGRLKNIKHHAADVVVSSLVM